MRRSALIPERLEAFVHLIKSEMGFRLHEAVRRVKFELSVNTEAQFEFHCEPVSITKKVTRLEFERWIEPEVALMAGCVDRLLSSTGVSARDIDHVFLTGGSSFVPAVRNIFVERFGSGEDYRRRRADVCCNRTVAVRRRNSGRRNWPTRDCFSGEPISSSFQTQAIRKFALDHLEY